MREKEKARKREKERERERERGVSVLEKAAQVGKRLLHPRAVLCYDVCSRQ